MEFFAWPSTFVAARDFSPINCDVSSNAPFNFLPVPVSSRTLEQNPSIFLQIQSTDKTYCATRNLTSVTFNCPACGCLFNTKDLQKKQRLKSIKPWNNLFEMWIRSFRLPQSKCIRRLKWFDKWIIKIIHCFIIWFDQTKKNSFENRSQKTNLVFVQQLIMIENNWRIIDEFLLHFSLLKMTNK